MKIYRQNLKPFLITNKHNKMNKYFIYNNQEILFFYCNTLDEAKQKAIMLSDNSKEIIVREIKEIRNYLTIKN